MKGRQFTVLYPLFLIALVFLPPLLIPDYSFHHWVHSLTAGLVLFALPGAILFPLMYARATWWTTHLGRAVMMMAIGNSGIIIVGVLRVMQDWPNISNTYSTDPLPIDMVRLLLYLWIVTAIYYKVFALYTVTRRGSDLHSDDAAVRAEAHESH